MLESSSADDIPPLSVLKLPADLIKKMSWPLLKTLLHGFQTIIESYVHITQYYTKNMVWKEASQGYKALYCTSQKNVAGPKKQYSGRNDLMMWSHVNSTGKSNVHQSPPCHLTKPQITWRGHTKRNLSSNDIRNVFLRSSTINSSICLPAVVILHNKSKSSIKSRPTM